MVGRPGRGHGSWLGGDLSLVSPLGTLAGDSASRCLVSPKDRLTASRGRRGEHTPCTGGGTEAGGAAVAVGRLETLRPGCHSAGQLPGPSSSAGTCL